MQGFTVPAVGGRSVLVRSGWGGEAVQLAIVSVYGNIIEAVDLDRAQLPAVLGALRRSQAVADRDLMEALKQRQCENDRRYRDALARNPWLNEARAAREKRGLR
jgi:hypothetical protein